MKTIAWLLPLVAFAGPRAHASETCSERGAFEAGYGDAIAGRANKPARELGRNCSGYSPSSYQKDYDSGFLKGQREICFESKARDRGREDALAFPKAKKYGAEILWTCPDASTLDRAYQKAFVRFACAKEIAEALGSAAGSTLSEGKPGLSSLVEHCPSASQPELDAAFERGFNARAASVCDASLLEATGRSDAREHRTMNETIERLSHCPASLRTAASDAYRRGFVSGEQTKLREKEIELESRRLELERRRAEIARLDLEREEAQRRERLRFARGFGASFPTLVRVNLSHLRATCEIFDGLSRHIRVVVSNVGNDAITFTGSWEIELRSAKGSYVGLERAFRSLTVLRDSDSSFEVPIVGYKARESEHCIARFR